jgi:hypothetical protein
MEFITIGIRATCRWQFGTAFSNRQIRWIIGIILQLRIRVGITVSKEGTFTKEEKPLDYSLLYLLPNSRETFHLSAASLTNQEYWHFQVHSDKQL